MRLYGLAFLTALLLLPLPAIAGRRAYLVNYDVPTVPDGDVEIETWIDFVSTAPPANQWRWWIGPRWAPHESIELAAFTIVVSDNSVMGTTKVSATELWAEQLDLRWHFFSHPRAGVFTAQFNARIAVVSDLPHQLSPQLGWATRLGRFGLAAQLGYAGGFGGSGPWPNYHWIVFSAGASVDVVRDESRHPFSLAWNYLAKGSWSDATTSPTRRVQLRIWDRLCRWPKGGCG